jgi:hypothetical protein
MDDMRSLRESSVTAVRAPGQLLHALGSASALNGPHRNGRVARQVWGDYDAERDLVLASDMNTGLWTLRVTT